MPIVSLEELLTRLDLNFASYEDQYAEILSLQKKGLIRPILSSPKNGKKPSLSTRFMLSSDPKTPCDYTELFAEMEYHLSPDIRLEYYRSHPKRYAEEREAVLLLNEFLIHHKRDLLEAVSCNERSFQIWHDEKFLQNKNGQTILKHCGIDQDFLHYYETVEPYAYCSVNRTSPQHVLVIENKDTFYSMRRSLMAKPHLFGLSIGTLIYGAGKRIIKSFEQFALSSEPYLLSSDNRFWYFGDLDYEGIGIYDCVAKALPYAIVPLQPAYRAMLKKADGVSLPFAREGQNQAIEDTFFSFFEPDEGNAIRLLLRSGHYIPQEILQISDFTEGDY